MPVDARALAAWRQACGYSQGDIVPMPYLFVLAFNAQAELLLDPASPFAPTGMVHIASCLEALREIRAGDALRLDLRLDGWRRVRQGRELDVEIRYFDGDVEVARGHQTSLARGGGTGEPRPAGERPGPPDLDFETWRLNADTGRRYAKVSGDWNPIHLWPLSALPFGYRRPIAHGMYLVARADAALAPAGDAVGRRLDVRFKTPTQLPGVVRLYRTDDGFELWRGDGSRPHVSGRFSAADASA
ncbi:MAG: MaoC/PaaZ C-terminal domain-containing protein [Acidobacteriota bacterium]